MCASIQSFHSPLSLWVWYGTNGNVPVSFNKLITSFNFSSLIRRLSTSLLNAFVIAAEIFEMLIKNTNTAITKTQILAHVWGADAELDENYVEVYISYLRKKLQKLSTDTKIKTIRGLGYKLTHV